MLLWWKLVGIVKALPTKLIIGTLVVLAVVVMLWLWRNSIIEAEQAAEVIRQHEAYRSAQEAISNAIESIRGASPDSAREWLRSFGETR